MERIIPVTLQFLLILGVGLMYYYIVRTIKKSNVRVDDMVMWLLGGAILLLFGLFPALPSIFSYIIGFLSPTNFIFTIILLFLLLMVFSLSIKVSQLQEKVKDLAHYHALLEHELKQKKESISVADACLASNDNNPEGVPPLDCYTYYDEMYQDR